jgi:hypothetical protein
LSSYPETHDQCPSAGSSDWPASFWTGTIARKTDEAKRKTVGDFMATTVGRVKVFAEDLAV